MANPNKNICVYPGQCKFPSCKCDQPETAKILDNPFITFHHPNAWSSGVASYPFYMDKNAPLNPPSGGPIETPAPKPVDPARPRFIYYVGGTNVSWPTSTQVKDTEKQFFEKYPHEREVATWIFVGTSGETRIERLS